ncbi:porin [Vibrio sp. WJH972]
MKKTLVALAVLAAGSVNAAEVYNDGGVSTSISGVAEVQLIGNEGYTDSDLAVRIDDFDLTASTSVALSEDTSAIGEVSIDEDAADRTFVGFSSASMGTITFGKQLYIADDAGIGADFEFGGAQYGTTNASGDDVIKYVFDNGSFFFGLSTDLEESDGENSDVDGRIGVYVGDLTLAIYALDGEATGFEESAYNVQATYSADALTFNASIGSKETNDVETEYLEANVKYSMDATSYALGFSTADTDGADDTVDTIYANVVNQLATNVRVYGEVGFQADATEELGYVAGMEVSF